MALTKDQMLQEAVQAGQAGDSARARELLLALLRTDNREPLYWLLMSTAVESRKERIYCLHNVLFLDPDNSAARHDLELLGADIPEQGAPAFFPEDEGEWQTSEIAAPKVRKRRKRRIDQAWSTGWIFGILLGGIVLIMAVFFATQQGIIPNFVNTATPGGSPAATGSLGAAGTPQPTATRQIVVAPRDPEELLQATYTATPRYLATPHPESAVFADALAAYDAQQWAEAASLFESYLATNPQAADAAYYLGQSRLQSGETGAAMAAFEQAIASNASFAYGYLGRARALIAQDASTASILTDLNTALLLDANLVEGYLERSAYNLSRANPNRALEDAIAAEAIAPNNALVLNHKAQIYLVRGEYENALQTALRAQEIDLTLLPSYLTIANAQQGLGLYSESVQTLQLYLGFEGEDGRGWELLGLAHQLNGNESFAREAFERALEFDPNLPSAAYYRGIQQLEAGQNEAALSNFRVAVTGAADWFEARVYLARALLLTGNPSSAFFEVNAGAPLAKSDSQRAQLFYWRATTLEALNQRENALPDWQSLLNLPASAMPAEWRQLAQERTNP
ncbi:MAG: tetratricopeptide repeat protein [Anaerolineales bacterium]|nr:MAG: tetratricopeptide repeat protein [Anaerolineales bacterium]